MFEQVLFAAAAAATIAGFLLEVWRETRSIVQEDDEGRNRKRIITDRAGTGRSKDGMGERGADKGQGVPRGAADKTGIDI